MSVDSVYTPVVANSSVGGTYEKRVGVVRRNLALTLLPRRSDATVET